NARRVSVVGDFNAWDGRRHAMRQRGATGVWEIFAPAVGAGDVYKYEIICSDGERLPLKADPAGMRGEMRPATGSIVAAVPEPGDDPWFATRAARHRPDQPISIYEVHVGSWQKREDGGFLNWQELAKELVPYAAGLGFTHIELMPITEHPFDGSWGYQPIGLFAPTARHGSADDFKAFVTACHDADIGLILDWVPAHFPSDEHGLARFDGTALYEHEDPREGFHKDWNTLIYNFGRREVANFLIANAIYWLRCHGVDGLRVDAVASMLYRDYSREDGQWIPNAHGGRENIEAIEFLRNMNREVYGRVPGVVTIAEESTAWPGVSQPVHHGGLGFGYKWNMGWMNDTLTYVSRDPVYRSYHHNQLTFGLLYAFTENFILPLSHDEVVHGKGSILDRMPGDWPDKFANLRAYYAFMFAHPGKKLLFMGQEFGQAGEWNFEQSLPWASLDDPLHRGVQSLVRDLNRIYRSAGALHAGDAVGSGFEWLDGSAKDACVMAWIRRGGPDDSPVVVVINFSGSEHGDWRVGVPDPGFWAEMLNTDASVYGGGGRGNLGGKQSEAVPHHGQSQSVVLTLPPLSVIFLQRSAPS
ncbi:MAG: 1,4-alpha-glucan branching protein GlgB, partial [Pseudomonadota bacterium]